MVELRKLRYVALGLVALSANTLGASTLVPIGGNGATINLVAGGPQNVHQTFTFGAPVYTPTLVPITTTAVMVANKCPPGHSFMLGYCRNVNECIMSTNRCAPEALCTDTVGSYTCICHHGYIGDGITCKVADACADAWLNTCSVHAACQNVPGGNIKCTCNSGYMGNGKSCTELPAIDKDACDDPWKNDCSENAVCQSLSGGNHKCVCNAGFTGSGVLCQPLNQEEAKDVIFTINCKRGYKSESVKDKMTCVDVDECDDSVHACAKDAACTNNIGSYTCACLPGFDGNGSICSLKGCGPGMKLSSRGECVDIDECATRQHDCSTNSVCANYEGGYSCQCANGYLSSADGLSCVKNIKCKRGLVLDAKENCVDDNECAGGNNNCNVNAFCENTEGSFTCTCRNGFTGNGLNCTSMTNCQKGYKELTEVCLDVDECNDGSDNCHTQARCSNIPGSFACACNFGYTGNGVMCDLIPNVTSSDGLEGYLDRRCRLCDAHARCTQESDEFLCECNNGFSGNGRACVEEKERCMPGLALDNEGSCADIDECALGQLKCPAAAVCVNTFGSSHCQCPEGQELGENKCQPITQEQFTLDEFDIAPFDIM